MTPVPPYSNGYWENKQGGRGSVIPARPVKSFAPGSDRSGVGTMLTVLRPRFAAELDRPGLEGEQGVVATATDVHAGWMWVPRWRTRISPALTFWPPEPLDAGRWALGRDRCASSMRPSYVPCLLLPLDSGDLEHRRLLTVTLALVVAGLVLELVDPDLRALDVLDDLGLDRHLGQLVGLGGQLGAVDDQRDGSCTVLFLAVELLDLHHVAFRRPCTAYRRS